MLRWSELKKHITETKKTKENKQKTRNYKKYHQKLSKYNKNHQKTPKYCGILNKSLPVFKTTNDINTFNIIGLQYFN
jgi:ribosomal protein S15P/S13E